jgi:1,4-alpha-glucan branching enzyme
VLNATPVPREGYRIGVPAGAGRYVEIFNSDSRYYGGGDIGNPVPLAIEPVPAMGYTQSVVLTVPPLACVVLAPR